MKLTKKAKDLVWAQMIIARLMYQRVQRDPNDEQGVGMLCGYQSGITMAAEMFGLDEGKILDYIHGDLNVRNFDIFPLEIFLETFGKVAA